MAHTHRGEIVSAGQDVTQLQEVHVPGVAEDLAQSLLLRGQHLICHREQEVAAGCPLMFQVLPEGLDHWAFCQVLLHVSNSHCQCCVAPLGFDVSVAHSHSASYLSGGFPRLT